MTRVRAFFRFLYDFVIGDDPLVAVVVTLALGVTALVVAADVPAWWILPVAVVAILADSLRRATSGR